MDLSSTPSIATTGPMERALDDLNARFDLGDEELTEELLDLMELPPEDVLSIATEKILAKQRSENVAWRTDLSLYAQQISGGVWKPYKHLQYAIDRVQKSLAKGGARIIINMPPRHGKSMTFSEYLPLWYIDNNPTHTVLLTSYEADLAYDFGRKVRDHMLSNPYCLTRLKQNVLAQQRWETSEGGGMVSASVGGPITGRGGQLLIIDDPIKNWKDAHSELMRQSQRDWYTSTFYTRAEPGASIILIMTRWTETDLTAYLLGDENDEEWEIINLPAIAEENDMMGRAVGEALCAARYDKVALARIRKVVKEQKWAGLFQQRPAPIEGNLFQRGWWKRWKILPARINDELISLDCAFENIGDSSFVVMQHLLRVKGEFFVIAQVRGRMTFTETKEAFKDFCKARLHVSEKLIEAKANGPAVISEIGALVGGIRKWQPKGKEAQAIVVSPYVEAGNVYIPDASVEGQDWMGVYIEEFAAFPNGKHDDQVDTTCQGILRLIEKRGRTSEINIDAEILDGLGRHSPWSMLDG